MQIGEHMPVQGKFFLLKNYKFERLLVIDNHLGFIYRLINGRLTRFEQLLGFRQGVVTAFQPA